MESYSARLFEDVKRESSLILLLVVTDEGILKKAGFTHNELSITKHRF